MKSTYLATTIQPYRELPRLDLDARMEMNTLYGSLAQGRFPELVQLVHVCVCVFALSCHRKKDGDKPL